MTFGENFNGTTFKVYLCLVKMGKPVGPRDVMREARLSSPSVAYRHLQKLVDLELVQKDKYGMYEVKEKVSFKGYFWFGKNLVPRLILYSLFFIGLLAVEITIIAIRLAVNEPIASAFILLTMITTLSAILFLFEGIQLKSKIRTSA